MTNAIAQSQALVELVAMREQLHQLWMRSGASSEQLVADFQTWLKTAEASNSATLREFAAILRSVRA